MVQIVGTVLIASMVQTTDMVQIASMIEIATTGMGLIHRYVHITTTFTVYTVLSYGSSSPTTLPQLRSGCEIQ